MGFFAFGAGFFGSASLEGELPEIPPQPTILTGIAAWHGAIVGESAARGPITGDSAVD